MHFDNFFSVWYYIGDWCFFRTNNKRGNYEKYNRICRKGIKWR